MVLHDLLLQRLLRAHVVRGAGDVERRREPVLVESFGEAEVEQPHAVLVVDHDVARLHVAVRDAGCVRRRERRRDVGAEARAVRGVALRDAQVLADAERPLDDERVVAELLAQVVEDRAEVAARHEVHRERERAVDFAERVHRHDRRMAQACSGRGFAAEPLDVARAQREARRKHLQRDAATQRRLMREVDDAHAAAAEFVLDHELAELAARRLCGCAVVLDDRTEEVVELQEVPAARADLLAQRFGEARRERGRFEVRALLLRVDEGFDCALHEVRVVRTRRVWLARLCHVRRPRRLRASRTGAPARATTARAPRPPSAGRVRCRSPRCRARGSAAA